MIFDNDVDSDFKSLYPSIIRAFNAFSHTLIGMIIINEMIHNKENRTHYEYYTRGGQFLEDLQSHQWIEFACRWFGLSSFDDMVDFVRYVFTIEIRPSRPFSADNLKTIKIENDKRIPLAETGKYYFPFTQMADEGKTYRPFEVMKDMPNDVKNAIEEWRNHVASEPNQSF